jgi:hypothetical protein
MANWSDTTITLTGTSDDVKKAYDYVQSHIEENYLSPLESLNLDSNIQNRAGYGGGEIHTIEVDNEVLTITMSGRWCSPSSYFVDVANKFNLSGTYFDAESGCDFIHLIEFENGEVILDEEYNYFSKEGIEHYGIEYYLEMYEWVVDDGETLEEVREEYPEIFEMFAEVGLDLDSLSENKAFLTIANIHSFAIKILYITIDDKKYMPNNNIT